MIRLEIEKDKYIYEGKKYDNLFTLARKLKQKGLKEQPIECYRDNVLCITVKSLDWLSSHSINKDTLKVTKYNSFFEYL